MRVKQSFSYRILDTIARWMDNYFLDPIIGFLFPGFGDVVSGVLSAPYIYFSLTVVRSVPLTLAVTFNVLLDMLIGSIPFLGDVLDIFDRSYRKNYRLITGFVEGDKRMISEVNRKTAWMIIAIILCLVLIYFAIRFTVFIVSWLIETVGAWF